jgi:hypothetical protein
MACWS